MRYSRHEALRDLSEFFLWVKNGWTSFNDALSYQQWTILTCIYKTVLILYNYLTWHSILEWLILNWYWGPFLAFITHIYSFFDKRSDNLHCQDVTVSLIKILPIHQLKGVNHIIVNKSGLNGFLFTEKCGQVFIPFLHNYMLSVGLVGDPDHGIASMRSNGQKMIIRMGGRN